MGVHLPHPDTLEHGLSDACPECTRKAKNPIAMLDSQHIEDLWNRMVAVENMNSRPYLEEPYASVRCYRTATEGDACRHLYLVALFLERHTRIRPWGPLDTLGDVLRVVR